MHQDAKRNLDDNVRRTAGVAALRQIHRLLATWAYQERRDRRIALVLGGVLILATVTAAAVYFSSLELVTIN